jgi:hypothetical protein
MIPGDGTDLLRGNEKVHGTDVVADEGRHPAVFSPGKELRRDGIRIIRIGGK